MLPNEHVGAIVMSADTMVGDPLQDPKSELDSHANMVVLGKHCFVFEWSAGQSCSVHPFSESLGSVKNVPIVDAAIAYYCPYRHIYFWFVMLCIFQVCTIT